MWLLLALALNPLGVLGTRLVFASLFLVAVVTWALRRGIAESARRRSASAVPGNAAARARALFRGNHLKALLYIGTVYTFWNLAAGTAGIFTPYLVKTVGAGTNVAGVALPASASPPASSGRSRCSCPSTTGRTASGRTCSPSARSCRSICSYGSTWSSTSPCSVIASVLLIGSAGRRRGHLQGHQRGAVPDDAAMPDTTGKSVEQIEAERAQGAPNHTLATT